MAAFSALPSQWIIEGRLKEVQGHQLPGEAIATLKVLIALNIAMDFHTHKTENVSLTKLSEVTNLSRPMIPRAIRKLESLGLIEVDRGGNSSKYTFLNFKPWAKLPKRNIGKYLRSLGNRSLSSLASLKILLLLLSARDAKRNSAIFMTHEQIRDKTGLQASVIRQGTDLLIEYHMISVYRNVEGGGIQRRPNEYTILNL